MSLMKTISFTENIFNAVTFVGCILLGVINGTVTSNFYFLLQIISIFVRYSYLQKYYHVIFGFGQSIIVSFMKIVLGTKIKCYGEGFKNFIKNNENSIYISNHLTYVDFAMIETLFWSKPYKHFSNILFTPKVSVRYMPYYGYILKCGSGMFICRSKNCEQVDLESKLCEINDFDKPFTIIFFPESMRFIVERKNTFEKAKQFALNQNLEPLEYTLFPRVGGLYKTLQKRSDISTIYDVTIYYEDMYDRKSGEMRSVGSITSFSRFLGSTAHIYIDAIPIENVPKDRKLLFKWLFQRFQKKNKLLKKIFHDQSSWGYGVQIETSNIQLYINSFGLFSVFFGVGYVFGDFGVACLLTPANPKRTDINGTPYCIAKRLHQIAICLACFLSNSIIFGYINCYGFVYKYIINSGTKENGNIATMASLLGSIKLSVLFFSGILSNIIIQKVGFPKATIMGVSLSLVTLLYNSYSPNITVLFLTYGVLHSIGSSLLFISSISILFYHFKRRIGLANAISTLGSPTATLIFPFFFHNYIEKYGINSYFALEGIMYCFLLLCALVWTVDSKENTISNNKVEVKVEFKITSNTDNQNEIIKQSKWTASKAAYIKIFRNRKYVVWLISMLFVFFSYPIPYIFTIKYAKLMTVKVRPELLLSTIGFGSIVGRSVSGFISDLQIFNRLIIQQVSIFLYGCCFILYPISIESYFVLIVCIIIGLCDGCIICLSAPISQYIVGPSNAEKAISCCISLISIPLFIGPIIAGVIIDKTDNYSLVYYVSSIYPFLATGLSLLTYTKIFKNKITNTKVLITAK
ncbi:Monocarboxylate transporter 1 [Intoshia linei]|uniref:Monocarboxylate transporter 1 n=1 Tax=Intoshia linei TaxID=1819745 RepID=A0A177B0Q0_9BILA|nr:Monocarboxylate transporter 1 [Intoshia linei]